MYNITIKLMYFVPKTKHVLDQIVCMFCEISKTLLHVETFILFTAHVIQTLIKLRLD